MTKGRTASAAARGPAEVSPIGEDAIDRIEQAWRRERPDIDVSSVGVISRIWRVSRTWSVNARNDSLSSAPIGRPWMYWRCCGAPARRIAGRPAT